MFRSLTSLATPWPMAQNAEVQLSWVPAAHTLKVAYTKYLSYLGHKKVEAFWDPPIVELGHEGARHALMFLNLELGLRRSQISIISLKLFKDKVFEEGPKNKKKPITINPHKSKLQKQKQKQKNNH